MSFQFRRRRRGEDHGVEDWLMTYADMITLLLCFFAIFLSMSTPKKNAFEKAREQIVKQFANPDTVPSTKPAGQVQEVPKSKAPFAALPSIVDRFNMFGDIEINQGDRIITIEMKSTPFFTSGSAELSREGYDLLGSLMKVMTAENLKEYEINVEGHTDDVPIRTVQFPSNWELSSGRAATLVKFFIEHGVAPQKVRASGYADAFPKFPNRDQQGNALPDNQARNRRVVIRLEKMD